MLEPWDVGCAGGVGRGAVPDPSTRRVRAIVAGFAVAVAAFGVWCASAAVREARAAEPSPMEVYRKFIKDGDPHVRRKAVASLEPVRGADAVNALLDATRDEDSGVRDRAESVLLAGRDRSDEIAALAAALGAKTPVATRLVAVRALVRCGKGGAGAVRGALADREATVRREAARGLGVLADRDGVAALHESLTDREPLVRAEACASIGAILGVEAEGAAAAVALGDQDPEPRIAALAILAGRPSAVGLDAALMCLGDRSWSLRTAAARTLAEFGRDAGTARRAVAGLVPAIEREDRMRVRVEIAESLWALTAADFGPDPKRWALWLRESGASFDPPAKRPRRIARDAGATHGGLADLPLESEHVCFVFDASSSMNDPVRFGAKRTKRDDLRDAFAAVVEKLPRGAWINLIPFATKPEPMRPVLFEANAAARSSTLKHLAKTPADGRTNIYDALEAALADPSADTLVLLTDGAPSAGRRTQRAAIVDGLRDMNRFRLARVHTVEIGSANTGARWKGFLADIAAATGGHHLAR